MSKYRAELRTTLKAESEWKNIEEMAHWLQRGKKLRTSLWTEGKETVARERAMLKFVDYTTMDIVSARRVCEDVKVKEAIDHQERRKPSPQWIELEIETNCYALCHSLTAMRDDIRGQKSIWFRNGRTIIEMVSELR